MKLFFDGGARPNPGAMRTAVVTRGLVYVRGDLGRGTSEQAEWLALLHALDVAGTLRLTDIILVGDSANVIAQAVGKLPSRSAPARSSRVAYDQRLRDFTRVRLRHVRRSQNLAGIALEAARED